MPTFGICGPLAIAAAARDAGWDFVEPGVRDVLQGDAPDADWTGRAMIAAGPLPVPAVNGLLPGDLKPVGDRVDVDRIETYLGRVCRRAATCGVQTIVFGAGAARNVPDDFDRAAARDQLLAFLERCARHADAHGVTFAVEPLNRGECNVINTVAEAMGYVRAVDHPRVRCLVDSYHLWLEREPLASVEEAGKAIAHVHVADAPERGAPGTDGTSDYVGLFAALKGAGYDGRISVEARGFEAAGYEGCLAFLKRAWAEA